MRLADYDSSFRAWLIAAGAELSCTRSKGELLRFFTHEGIGTVYVNSRDKVTLSGVAGHAYQAFRNKLPWQALPRPRDSRQERLQQWTLLSARDGPSCCYCGGGLTFETFTLEHFLAKTFGGTNYYANLGLACEPCNRDLGSLPISQKIQRALERRLRHESFSHTTSRNAQDLPAGRGPRQEPTRGPSTCFGPYSRGGYLPRDEGGH